MSRGTFKGCGLGVRKMKRCSHREASFLNDIGMENKAKIFPHMSKRNH
jgi:hypothetical protein